LNILITKYCHLDLFGTCLLSYLGNRLLSGCDSRRSLAGRLKNLFEQVTVETFDSRIANAGDGLGLWGSLAVRTEAREGDFHGLTLDCCLPSRRLAGRALEERNFTAHETVSQQVQ